MATALEDARAELDFWTCIRNSYTNGVTEYTVNGKTVKRVSFEYVCERCDFWRGQVSMLSGSGVGCIRVGRPRGDY